MKVVATATPAFVPVLPAQVPFEYRVPNMMVFDVPSAADSPASVSEHTLWKLVEGTAEVYGETRRAPSSNTRMLQAKFVWPTPPPVVVGSDGARYCGTVA